MKTFCILIATLLTSSCGTDKQSQKNSTSAELPSENFDAITALMMANSHYEKDNYQKAAEGFAMVTG